MVVNQGTYYIGILSIQKSFYVILFQAEWEALEICDHQWTLKNIESDLAGITAA